MLLLKFSIYYILLNGVRWWLILMIHDHCKQDLTQRVVLRAIIQFDTLMYFNMTQSSNSQSHFHVHIDIVIDNHTWPLFVCLRRHSSSFCCQRGQNPQPVFTKEVVDVTGGSDDEDLVEVNKAVAVFFYVSSMILSFMLDVDSYFGPTFVIKSKKRKFGRCFFLKTIIIMDRFQPLRGVATLGDVLREIALTL